MPTDIGSIAAAITHTQNSKQKQNVIKNVLKMNWTDGHMNMVKKQQKRLAAKAKEVPAKNLHQRKKLPEAAVVVVEVAWLFKRLKRNLI